MAEGLSVLRELVVKLGFEVDEQALEGIEHQVESLKKGLEVLTLVWDAAVVGAFELVHETAELGHEIEATASVLGLSTDQYQKYKYAADLAGLGAENFTTAVSLLTRNVGEAIHGMGSAGMAFRALGVSFQDGNGHARNTSDLLSDLTVAFSRLHDPAEQARLSTELFGRSGLRMGALLARGGFELAKVSAEVEAFGFFTEERVEQAEKVHGSMRAFFALLKGISNEFAFHLFGSVQRTLDKFRAWALVHKEIINQRLGQFAKALAGFIESGANAAMMFVHALGKVVQWLGGAENATKLLAIALASLFASKAIVAVMDFVSGLKEAGGLVKLIGGLFESPLGMILLIAAALAGVILLVQDFMVWMRGGKSVFGDMLGPFDAFKKKMEDMFEPVRQVFRDIREDIKLIGEDLKSLIPPEVLQFIRFVKGAYANPGAGAASVPNYASSVQSLIPKTNYGSGTPLLDQRASLADMLRGLGGAFAPSSLSLIYPGAFGRSSGGSPSVVAPVNLTQNFNVQSGTPEETVREIARISRETARDTISQEINHAVHNAGGQ